MQARIDAGSTTLQDVFGGLDETPAARRLLALSQQNLAAAAADLPAEVQAELAEEEVEHQHLLARTEVLDDTDPLPPGAPGAPA